MRRFIDGDKITANDLNDLIVFSNLSFTNAAARDAFLVGSLAPLQGMRVHMQDDGITYSRITVGGSSYWAPAAGSHTTGMIMAAMGGSASQTLNVSGTPTRVNLTSVKTKNINSWWANNQFTPTVPGYYEIEALVCFSTPAVDGYRAAWLGLNGISMASAVPGSMSQLYPAGSSVSDVLTVTPRPVIMYFNGTDGSYVTLVAMHTSSSTHDLVSYYYANAYSGYGCVFNVRYLGM
jgi:hypothetical protein